MIVLDSFQFDIQTNISLRERVTNDIRHAILNGQLMPGERLKEAHISKQMGVSRGPVREAIRQLEREGLLISQPYKETVIADINIEEVRDVLIPIRFHLEWFVIINYIEQMDSYFFEKLQSIINQMVEPINQDSLHHLVELDVAFHETIIGFSKEKTVKMTWQSILNQIRLHFIKNIKFFDKENLKNDHQQLLNKLKTKNLKLIQDELLHHMEGDESFLCFIKI